jgi:proteasome activator subunit 4
LLTWTDLCNGAGQFLSNLKSELPPLRPLSVAALLLLLQPGPYKVSRAQELPKYRTAIQSAEQSVTTSVQEENYADKIVSNLGFDHAFAEGAGRSVRSMMRSMPELGLTALLPSFVREWPRTRTWDAVMNGEAFSSNHAKLFKRLIQEGGETVLNALRGPLEEAVNSVEERGKQCVAAELVAGLLHSDVQCVQDAWPVWFRSLLRKALLQSSVESAQEWAACVRFAVTGKGRLGRNAPLLRSQVLESLVEPLAPSSASTSLVTKRLMFLRAALVEVSPASWSTSDVPYQATILSELMTCMTHPAAQVRFLVPVRLHIVIVARNCTSI